MQKIYKGLFPGLIFLLFLSCKNSKEIYYSYKVDSYATDTVKNALFSNRLISYGDYLFEFKIKVRLYSKVDLESGAETTSSVNYDTTGIYLLQVKNPVYYEFDTFAIKNNVVKTGKLVDKEFGMRLSSSKQIDTAVSYSIPKRTLVNNVKCFYSEITSKNKSINDTVKLKLLLIKNANLNSLYKISAVTFADNAYCIVGINLFSPQWNQGYVEEIDSIRPLTKKEKSLCEDMVIKSRSAVIDTIKGL